LWTISTSKESWGIGEAMKGRIPPKLMKTTNPRTKKFNNPQAQKHEEGDTMTNQTSKLVRKVLKQLCKQCGGHIYIQRNKVR
jgi:hypothetical protein